MTEPIEPKPALMLNYLYEKVWKIRPVRRDHLHNDRDLWVDEPPKAGVIRTHCKLCGDLIGYRPAPKSLGRAACTERPGRRQQQEVMG